MVINVMTAPHQEALLVVWGINVMTAPHQEGILVLRGINVMMAPHPNCPTLDDVVESFPVVGGGGFSLIPPCTVAFLSTPGLSLRW